MSRSAAYQPPTADPDETATGLPVLYLAPWVDYGGTAKGTLDWFRWLDRERFTPSLITTQPAARQRLLPDVAPYAEELWDLPQLMPGGDMPRFICDFVHSRGIRVVHMMNSRLGFELIPDLCLLPRPPVIVVQLHVEEEARGGYVRYVTTRYANLVDAFSVTSHHLARTMIADYDVSPTKCVAIHTGVDAEREFTPDAVEPEPGLGQDGRVEILFLGRLVPQKDPRLMLEVVAALRAETDAFRVNVVGYGELEPELREAVRAQGLEDIVALRGPTHEAARWLAGCDLLLMTSVYEGIPYVLFEAMAMEIPAVAPALPGVRELMDGTGGRMIEVRDDVPAYVEALRALIEDPVARRTHGRAARARVREHFSLERMGTEHGALYDRLLGEKARNPRLGLAG